LSPSILHLSLFMGNHTLVIRQLKTTECSVSLPNKIFRGKEYSLKRRFLIKINFRIAFIDPAQLWLDIKKAPLVKRGAWDVVEAA
jgi:hypothetical protein